MPAASSLPTANETLQNVLENSAAKLMDLSGWAIRVCRVCWIGCFRLQDYSPMIFAYSMLELFVLLFGFAESEYLVNFLLVDWL
jgi:hypothetical protein